jgi:hypothetical protein
MGPSRRRLTSADSDGVATIGVRLTLTVIFDTWMNARIWSFWLDRAALVARRFITHDLNRTRMVFESDNPTRWR